MGERKVSTTVYITRSQADRLKLLNERTKVPVAEYIRQGIDRILEENADKLPGQLSLGAAMSRD
ncbi:MAG: ribbon-helix-helix domain-containing protein [Myxococcota bacterium]